MPPAVAKVPVELKAVPVGRQSVLEPPLLDCQAAQRGQGKSHAPLVPAFLPHCQALLQQCMRLGVITYPHGHVSQVAQQEGNAIAVA